MNFPEPTRNGTLFVLIIDRNSVESCDVSLIEEFFANTIASEEELLSRINQVAFSVDGYDDDARELFDIPEVRDYFRRVNELFPSFFYFLEPTSRHAWLGISCAKDSRKIDGQIQIEFDKTETLELVMKCWGAGNTRLEEFSILEHPIVEAHDKALHNWLKSLLRIE
jgi:hypothetical protein